MASLKDIVIYAGVFIAGMVFHAQIERYVDHEAPIHPASRPTVPTVEAPTGLLEGIQRVAQTDVGGSATLAHFNRIQNGMTYADVLAIIGAEGTESMEYRLMGTLNEHFDWRGVGRGYSNLTVYFQNGYVSDKMHIGLK